MSYLRFSTFVSATLLSVSLNSYGIGKQPFSVEANVAAQTEGQAAFSVIFSVPRNHYLYADSISVTSGATTNLVPANIPQPYRKHDQFSGAERDVYTNDFAITYSLPGPQPAPLELAIGFQGCSDQLCFLPVTTNIILSFQGATLPVRATIVPGNKDIPKDDWNKLISGFKIHGRLEGYVGSDAFLRFLADSEKGNLTSSDRIREMFHQRGMWTIAAVLLIFLGGLGLNLTPCVLPMIPINIAIIGAGTEAGSRTRGFMLGGIYGAAIALTYGILGLAVVLTGSRFGVLNSSYLFNAVIAVIFIILAVAMFDVFTIDFSRFQGTAIQSPTRKRNLASAFFMGVVSALLAGACVAPVVVSALLLSSDLYRRGEIIGLFLPFVLGAGMGSPWPFMGAGLSFLPKPGRWMERIKHLFGIVIIGFAIYYGHLAWRLYSDNLPENRSKVESAQQESIKNGWLASLPDALALARKENKPVFVDFWASWCKNCLAMEETTFKNPEVIKQLDRFIKVKYRAEHPNAPETRAMLEYFNCVGLPTYVVLVPAITDRK